MADLGVIKMTVNVGPDTQEALRLIMDREGVTLTEALRRLIGYGDTLYRAVKVDGKEALLRDHLGLAKLVLRP